MKKNIVVIFVYMLLIVTSLPLVGAMTENKNKMTSSQLYGVEWAKTYGGSEFDMFHCVHQTSDGGYITSGATEVSNRYFPILTKLDSNGNEDWQWTISQISYEQVSYDIQDVYPIFCNQVSGGGYALCL